MSIETDRATFWNQMHSANASEELYQACDPTPFAYWWGHYVPKNSRILEIGPGTTGRDARFFAREKNCTITCIDVSLEAARSIRQFTLTEGIEDRIQLVVGDGAALPFAPSSTPFDVLYARSSLYLTDDDLVDFIQNTLPLLSKKAIIMLEGKTLQDYDIARSVSLGNGLFVDQVGHVRRVLTEDIMWRVVNECGLSLHEKSTYELPMPKGRSKYFNFIAGVNKQCQAPAV